MTPQSSFMVVAPIDPQREPELRGLLASMNDAPGRLKEDPPLLPFSTFETLHMARLLIVEDGTVEDTRLYGLPPGGYPRYFSFLGDVDGAADDFLEEAARRAPEGLRALFSCCEGFAGHDDLAAWMKAHNLRPAANYVNWVGRTVRQVHEEARLHDAVQAHLCAAPAELEGANAAQVHQSLRRFIDGELAAGRLRLTPPAPTPLGWRVRNLLHLIGLPLLALLLSPLLLVIGIVAAVRLRQLEKSDPELCPRADVAAGEALADLEDHDVTNQFSAMGSLKPGALRLLVARVVLAAIDYGARHIYTRGGLARVRTIHFARWVFLDDRKRIIFLSNYDGSLESYMDDFINKVGFGLNVVFSNGIGYPRTNWLLLDGCHDERKFKEYLRRHQMPTQVWYKAYPGLTAIDLERHSRIRQGLEAAALPAGDARRWAALL